MRNKRIRVISPNKTIFNFEVIRDFCGGCGKYVGTSIEATSLFYLPDAIDILVKNYHYSVFPKADQSIDFIQTMLIFDLKDIIPLDSDKWDDPDLIYEVYRKVFINNTYGDYFMLGVTSITNSDYYQAKKYIINEVSNPEMQKILDKAINGIKPNSLNLNFKKFEHINENHKKLAESTLNN